MPEANGNSNEPTLAERVFAEQSASLSQPPADTASTGEPHAVGETVVRPTARIVRILRRADHQQCIPRLLTVHQC